MPYHRVSRLLGVFYLQTTGRFAAISCKYNTKKLTVRRGNQPREICLKTAKMAHNICFHSLKPEIPENPGYIPGGRGLHFNARLSGGICSPRSPKDEDKCTKIREQEPPLLFSMAHVAYISVFSNVAPCTCDASPESATCYCAIF